MNLFNIANSRFVLLLSTENLMNFISANNKNDKGLKGYKKKESK
jgi:hypothetical protein